MAKATKKATKKAKRFELRCWLVGDDKWGGVCVSTRSVARQIAYPRQPIRRVRITEIKGR